MANMTIEEVLDNKYITDSSLAQQLVEGTLTLDDQIIKDHVHQTGAYLEIYGSNEVSTEGTVEDPIDETTEDQTDETNADPVDEEPTSDPTDEPAVDPTDEPESDPTDEPEADPQE